MFWRLRLYFDVIEFHSYFAAVSGLKPCSKRRAKHRTNYGGAGDDKLADFGRGFERPARRNPCDSLARKLRKQKAQHASDKAIGAATF
jgi:hypothetical protein